MNRCANCHIAAFGIPDPGTMVYVVDCGDCGKAQVTGFKDPEEPYAPKPACEFCGSTMAERRSYDIRIGLEMGQGCAKVDNFKKVLCEPCSMAVSEHMWDSLNARGILLTMDGAVEAMQRAGRMMSMAMGSMGVNANKSGIERAIRDLGRALAGRQPEGE